MHNTKRCHGARVPGHPAGYWLLAQPPGFDKLNIENVNPAPGRLVAELKRQPQKGSSKYTREKCRHHQVVYRKTLARMTA